MVTERIEPISQEVTGGQVVDPPVFLNPEERLISQTIIRGRIAREVLQTLRNSSQWYFVNQRNKQLILEILQESQGLEQPDEDISGGKLPQLRVATAILHIKQALAAQQVQNEPEPQESVREVEPLKNSDGHQKISYPAVFHPVITQVEQPPEPRAKRKYTRKPKEITQRTEPADKNIDLLKKNDGELLAIIHQGRLARNILLDLTKTPGFTKLSQQERIKALQTYQDSQDLRGYVLLPTHKVRGVSTKEAIEQIELGAEAQQGLITRLSADARRKFETEYPDHVELFNKPISLAVAQTIREARNAQTLDQVLSEKLRLLSKDAVEQAQALIRAEQEASLLNQYTNLIHKIVNKLAFRLRSAGIDYEDAVQEASLMLLVAQKSYDPEKGALLPYLHTRIYGRLMDIVRSTLPASRMEQRNSKLIEAFDISFEAEQERKPTIEEVSLATGLTINAITNAMTLPREISGEIVLSINIQTIFSAIKDDDPLSSPEQLLLLKEELSEMGSKLSEAFAILSPREKRLIIAYYAEDKPFHIAGREIGISGSRAQQIHKRIIRKMQEFLAGTYKPIPKSLSLRDFLKELGVSYWTFNNKKLAEGLRLRRDKSKTIIINSAQQRAIRRRLEKQRQLEEQQRTLKKGKETATTRGMRESDRLQIKKLLEAMPGLEDLTPEEFTILAESGDEELKRKVASALSPLTPPERETMILRLSLVTREVIARRLRTTVGDVKIIEEAAIYGIKNRRSIVKFPSGEVIQVR